MLARVLVLVSVSWPALAIGQPIIGEPAPVLGDAVTWVLGPTAPTYEPGQVYVLDFWATWCPPCYPMIDDLTQLAAAHREDGLVIVGVAVGTDLGTPLERFVEKEKDRIGYTIAKPEDDEALKRALFHPALADPDDFYLPTLVIIDRQGRLAWVSEPGDPKRGFDEALAAILAGRFDLEGARRAAEARVKAKVRGGDRLAEIRQLRDAGSLREASRALVTSTAEAPEVYAPEAAALFVDLMCLEREQEASALAVALLEEAGLDRVPELVLMTRAILFLGRDDQRDLEFAERLASNALALSGGNHPDFLYSLAKVAYARSDQPASDEYRRRAIAAAEEQGWDEQYRYVIGSLPIERVMDQQALQLRQQCADL